MGQEMPTFYKAKALMLGWWSSTVQNIRPTMARRATFPELVVILALDINLILDQGCIIVVAWTSLITLRWGKMKKLLEGYWLSMRAVCGWCLLTELRSGWKEKLWNANILLFINLYRYRFLSVLISILVLQSSFDRQLHIHYQETLFAFQGIKRHRSLLQRALHDSNKWIC